LTIQVLLLDEPVSAQDPQTALAIMRTLGRMPPWG
tara:strand:+ start:433 stop:537 length:105 start_codon:yes stop_codon:yes gene_type:complete